MKHLFVRGNRLRFFTREVWLWLCLASSVSLHAATTNFVQAYRGAIQSQAAVWGSPNLGTAMPVVSNPQAAAIAARLQQVVGQFRSSSSSANSASAPGVSNLQQVALARLVAQAGSRVEVHLRPGNLTVIQIRGQQLQPATVSAASVRPINPAETTARQFLRAYHDLFRLDDPDQELKLESQQVDEQGHRHLRFSQQYQGLPVWPDSLSVHLDPQGNVDTADGAYVPTPRSVGTQPTLSASEAETRAQASVRSGLQTTVKDTELIIYGPLQQPPCLAWKTTVATDFMHAWEVIVDAQNGQVLDRLALCMDANVATSAADLKGVTRNINVWSTNGNYYMADTTKLSFNPAFDPINDPHGVITIFDARQVTQPQLQTVYVVATNSATTWLPDAVSAMFNLDHTYDFYLAQLNRNSVDGQGGNIRAAVRVHNLDNAFWSGEAQMMFFGDAQPYPAALDVVGHELTHGVTESTANLVYELQPGALNEALSDIFGEMAEASVVGQADWKVGTGLNKPLRDMRNPGSITINGMTRGYPANMSQYLDLPNTSDSDHGGVHINSCIVSHAYYLLAAGLPGAIGLQDAEKIFYTCLTEHLHPQSQFIDARLGCIAAAEDLFDTNSTQAAKTAQAFDAVGIYATPSTPPPPPLPVVQGPDSTLLVTVDSITSTNSLERREDAFGDPKYGTPLVGPVVVSRPSVSGDGSYATFINATNDMGLVDTANPINVQYLGFPGMVYSVAMSPDGNKFAFVLRNATTGLPTNQITVVDLIKNTNRTFDLVSPVTDAGTLNNVLYAQSMVFTADGNELLYDDLSSLNLGSGSSLRWSISRINLATETTTVIVPPLAGYNVGNPSLGRASGDRYLTFDATDLASGTNFIVNLDLFSGDLAVVATSGQDSGYPSFTGDESAIVYAAPSTNGFFTGHSLFEQPLDSDRLTPNGSPTNWVQDAYLGVIYRRGTYAASNALPVVTLTSPTNSESFAPPATISITASASDSDGIAKVEFYLGSTKLGEDTIAPYGFTWTNVTNGSYRLIARAVDNLGATSDSAPVNVTVGASNPIRMDAARVAGLDGNGIRITLTAPAGDYLIEDSTTLTNWNPAFSLTIDASGTGTTNDTRTPSASGRLFYRAQSQ